MEHWWESAHNSSSGRFGWMHTHQLTCSNTTEKLATMRKEMSTWASNVSAFRGLLRGWNQSLPEPSRYCLGESGVLQLQITAVQHTDTRGSKGLWTPPPRRKSHMGNVQAKVRRPLTHRNVWGFRHEARLTGKAFCRTKPAHTVWELLQVQLPISSVKGTKVQGCIAEEEEIKNMWVNKWLSLCIICRRPEENDSKTVPF